MSWTLTLEQRNAVVQRMSASIAGLAMSLGKEIPDVAALDHASGIEKKAYTAAQVGSTTTHNAWDSGSRPASETTKAYARKLSELLLEVVCAGDIQQAKTDASTAGVLDLTGSRDFLTKESAEETLKVMLVPDASISKIKFSTKSFGRDAANVAASAIKNCSASLVDADISDMIAGRPEDEALDALRIVCEALASAGLRRLNLSDNALGEKGVRACAAAITSQAALESLALQNVGCSIHACRAVEELLQASQALKQLHLFNNMSADEGAEYIAKILSRAPLMEDFRMVSSRVGPRGGSALALGLTSGSHLVRLDLSDNPMTAEVAPAVAECVRRQPHLKYLNLNDTSLTDQGVKLVCTALSQPGACQLLEELELALNEITHEGARSVALAVLGKPLLWRLNLRENELEDKGGVVIGRAVALMPALKVLDACGNQIKRVGAVALAKAAATQSQLELLQMDENMISEEGLDEVKSILKVAGKLNALGPLDENMEEDDEELDDEDLEGDDELSAAFSKAAIA
ncbi:hypothetical protein CEUSTIGMA_g8297.t1 [Chlamydomonas eustigma]|uniref:WPP domain-containing protein n=1 Tax=Chlamydomonas eustigma TaxID=1157962 RepID=A0A250XD99_9CHLO|nr:hypothetical protein CEUSTIGMA_g8297.t1 [Chlamydomonas eustigma]|eukprot:GAX80862.1 hypothetical protein CEUSTIGMA_g8297.t1 [Chlamydomonas eustigma]